MPDYLAILGPQRRADITISKVAELWKYLAETRRVVAEPTRQNGLTRCAGRMEVKVLGEPSFDPACNRAYPVRSHELGNARFPHVQHLGKVAQQCGKEIFASQSRSHDGGGRACKFNRWVHPWSTADS